MTVIFAFYVSRRTFRGIKRLNRLFFSQFFSSRIFFRFLGKFFLAGLPNMQSIRLETFSHEMCFLRKLVVYVIIFKSWAEGFWIFVQFFGSVVKNAFLVCGGTFRGKTFFPKKSQLCFLILVHKILIPRNNSACTWKLSLGRKTNIRSYFFWKCN